jgi:hypothetical protein
MSPLILKKKTGFKVNDNSPVIIRDFRGKIFYDTTGLRQVLQFNLPEGTYFIDKGNITPLLKPVTFQLIKLPIPERKLKPPLDFTILFASNPNKCTINWDLKTITFDNSLKGLSLPEIFFILYHEYGHSLYKTEKYADGFAANMMLKKGYNPSQAGKAPITSLSHRQLSRKKYIVNKLIGNAYKV